MPSAKLDALFEQLDEVIAEGHRALVFSQFTSFLQLAAARLDAAGVPYAYLDGSTRRRSEVIDRFRTGKAPVFLISLKAGGFGLNLTEADYVFLLDPWWNPASEAQAVDRAHRIGQSKTVMVYRMVADGHHRGEGHGAEGQEGRARVVAHGRRRPVQRVALGRRHPRAHRGVSARGARPVDGAPGGTRTPNLLLRTELLFH